METFGKIAIFIIGTCGIIVCIGLTIFSCKIVYDEIKSNNKKD